MACWIITGVFFSGVTSCCIFGDAVRESRDASGRTGVISGG